MDLCQCQQGAPVCVTRKGKRRAAQALDQQLCLSNCRLAAHVRMLHRACTNPLWERAYIRKESYKAALAWSLSGFDHKTALTVCKH